MNGPYYNDQGYNAVRPARLEPAPPWSPVEASSTLPPSQRAPLISCYRFHKIVILLFFSRQTAGFVEYLGKFLSVLS